MAEQLYYHLHNKGYLPWLDKKKIKAGENWDYAINKALKESTFIILLLSSVSVNKRGYVQKEFNLAIEYSKNMLIDDIYIIPILLDNCKIPDHLSKFQWVAINNENAIEEILDSLNSQRKKYLDSLPPEQIGIDDYSSASIELNIPVPPDAYYKCDLPFFHENNFFDAHFVNAFIQHKVLDVISEYRKWSGFSDESFSNNHRKSFYLDISHSIIQLNKDFLSLSITYDTYFGGAHPNIDIETLNFAFNPERHLQFSDIIEYEYNGFHKLIREWVHQFGDKEQEEALDRHIDYLTESNINFTFTNNTLNIDFDKIFPHVIQALSSLEIPLEELPKNIVKINRLKR